MTHFDFIIDSPLKEKLIETLHYIEFLLGLEKSKLTSEIHLLLNRDIIIHSVSILEWLLLYLLMEIEKHGSDTEKKIIKNYTIKKEYIPVKISKELYFSLWEEEIFFCKKKEIKWKVNGKWNLGNIAGLVKKLNILPKDIEEGIKNIQHIRNDIHLQRVIENIKITEELTDEEMLELFQFTKALQQIIESKLSSL